MTIREMLEAINTELLNQIEKFEIKEAAGIDTIKSDRVAIARFTAAETRGIKRRETMEAYTNLVNQFIIENVD